MNLDQLGIITVAFAIGMGWATVKIFISKKEKENGGGRTAEKIQELDMEIRAMKILILGLEGQGGLVEEVKALRRARHQAGNEIQNITNKLYVVEQRLKDLES